VDAVELRVLEVSAGKVRAFQVGARQGGFAEINAGKVELQGPLMREASPSKHGESGLDVSRS
jgi:hypothetical protein